MGVDYDYADDELVLEDDPEGEKKIDKNGNLLGGNYTSYKTSSTEMRSTKVHER